METILRFFDPSRLMRDAPPAHYIFKVDSFSTLVEEKINILESDDFEVGGYKWGLCLYPNGDDKRNGKGHISLYLVLRDIKNLPRDWEVSVQFKLFVYDHIRDKYLTIQDTEGKPKRFHSTMTECGFDKLVSQDSFNERSNGYLLNDSCVFGVEIFVVKYSGNGESVSLTKNPEDNTFTWQIENFAAITNPFLFSEEFIVGEQKWKLMLYPKGNEKSSGSHVSLFLCLADNSSVPLKRRLFTKFKLRIKDQSRDKHYEALASCWYSASNKTWGFRDFKDLWSINHISNGFLFMGTLIVEVEFLVISVIRKFQPTS